MKNQTILAIVITATMATPVMAGSAMDNIGGALLYDATSDYTKATINEILLLKQMKKEEVDYVSLSHLVPNFQSEKCVMNLTNEDGLINQCSTKSDYKIASEVEDYLNK